MPDGPPETLIAPAGFNDLPSNLSIWISCSAMHCTRTRVEVLFHAAPWHQTPTLASATFRNFIFSTAYTGARPFALRNGDPGTLFDPFITVTTTCLPSGATVRLSGV